MGTQRRCLSLWGGTRQGCFSQTPLRGLNPIPDLSQCLAHLTNAAIQLGHGLAYDMHAAGHVLVHGHQLLAEALEHLCLLSVDMEELPVQALGGRAGVWLWGSIGSLGLGGGLVHGLRLGAYHLALVRGGRRAEQGGPGRLGLFPQGPLRGLLKRLPRRPRCFIIFIILGTEAEMDK